MHVGEHDPVLSQLLGPIEGLVGGLDEAPERVGMLSQTGYTDADRDDRRRRVGAEGLSLDFGADTLRGGHCVAVTTLGPGRRLCCRARRREPRAIDKASLGDGILQALPDRTCRAGPGAGQRHGKLIAAIAGNDVDLGARVAAQQHSEGAQERVSGRVTVARLPSDGEVSDGQFAWRPDPTKITAQITRNARGFNAPFTVAVENGSGALGIGTLVIDKLVGLNVNLPAVRNAASFNYADTQILAGAKAFAVANQVRGILGHGVVLTGSGLPDTTVIVIVGKDLQAKDLQ